MTKSDISQFFRNDVNKTVVIIYFLLFLLIFLYFSGKVIGSALYYLNH